MRPARKGEAGVAPTEASNALTLPLHAEAACDLSGDGSHGVIAIDYGLPASAAGRALGMLFGPMYARWCVGQMTWDLVDQFGAPRE